MAAILCQSVGTLCSSVGKVISYPCRMCGDACGSCCRATGQVLMSPFSPYLITTLALNLPPLVFGAQSMLTSQGQRCEGDTWLWVNSLLCLGHVLASFYIVNRIQEEERRVETADAEVGGVHKAGAATPSSSYNAVHDDNQNKASVFTQLASITSGGGGTKSSYQTTSLWSHDPNSEGHAGSIQRLKQVLCYDAVVALYILMAIFWVCWQSMGVSQAISSNGGDDSEFCDHVLHWSAVSLTCGFVYAMMVCMVFSCSLLCLRR